MLYLYQVENLVSGKKYIGFTNDPERRKYEHFTGRGSKLIWNAIKKYGQDNFEFKILRVDEDSDFIKFLEIEKIKEFNAVSPNGYNLTEGGEGLQNASSEIRKRQGQTLKSNKTFITKLIKRNKSPWMRKKASEAGKKRKGSITTKETKQKISKSLKGKKKSKESSQRKSISLKGRKQPWHQGSKNPVARRVLINGIEYGCILEAANTLGIKRTTLQARFNKWKQNNSFPEGYKYLD